MLAHIFGGKAPVERLEERRRAAAWARVLLGSLVAASAMLGGGCGELPAVEVEFEGAAITGEDGTSAQVGITLTEAPKGVLYIRAVSSDLTEGRASQLLRIDGSNWQLPQSISVTGVDDDEVDGDVEYEVSVEVRRAFGGWQELGRATFRNRDNDGAIFHRLGDLPGGDFASYVSDVSATGVVVAGYSVGETGEQAVRWTAATGLTALHVGYSRANGVSPDGTILTGMISVEGDGQHWSVGVLWRGGQAAEVLDPFEPSPTSKLVWFAEGKVVFDDGLVYGRCQFRGSYGEPVPCRVDPGVMPAVRLPGSYNAQLNDADEAGHFVGGIVPNHGQISLFRGFAMYDGKIVPFPDGENCSITPGTCFGAAYGLSQGSTLVGSAETPAGAPARAFVGSPQGMRWLPDLEGGVESGAAYAISADGRVIGGLGQGASGAEAVLWIDGQPRSLAALISEAGGVIPPGFVLLEVKAISEDGRTLVGNGRNEQGNPEGFHVVLPRLAE